MLKRATTQALQNVTLLPKIIPSCPSGATLEKLISPNGTKFHVGTQVFRPMTRLHTRGYSNDQDVNSSDEPQASLPVCISKDPLIP
ncbi:unnamed protein product [Phytophthora fragariaefolia]|uniref:Unnamed protein product n=1 Tax=Phytophthora fragariaefolia TaxID=1490495 RepID=A0A9W6WVY4_9STRA|nr:unnamed protein product [Phytophthora fragariaefolia]